MMEEDKIIQDLITMYLYNLQNKTPIIYHID